MKSIIAGLLLICSGVFLAGRGVAQGSPPSPGVPFKEGVDVEINGHGPYVFGLDIGSSPAFLIAPGLSRELSLPVTSHVQSHAGVEHANDPPMDVVHIDDLLLAGHLFHRVIGIAHPNASPTVKNGSGLLGIGLFQNVVVKLDYPSNRLSISEQSLPPENGKDVFQYTDVHFLPYVDIVLGGVPVNACIDTGAQDIGADMSVPADFASRLRLRNLVKSSAVWTDINGRKHEFSTATLDGDLVIGSVVVHDPSLLISDAVPFVNLAGVVKRMAISLDPQDHRVKLEIPEKPRSE
jgi:hypothetical protein